MCAALSLLFPEMGVFAPPSSFFKKVKCVRESEILVEQSPPQGVLVCGHAGLVINDFSLSRSDAPPRHRRRRFSSSSLLLSSLELSDTAIYEP